MRGVTLDGWGTGMSAGDQNTGPESGSGFGWTPPPPDHPPTVGPSPAADPVRAVAAALLNLSGLGLGYVLLRCWLWAALCWVATAALVLIALPADPDGVPGGLLVAFAVFLLLAALDGARRARHRATGLPLRPAVAVALGLVLLAVPAGSVVAYGAQQDEAVELMLLDRLAEADKTVDDASRRPLDSAIREKDYRAALAGYRELDEEHPGSRAAKLVPDRLEAYYKAVAEPYRAGEHCTAIESLKYLRTVPDTVDKDLLGDLAGWPDGPLATSLYECGMSKLGEEETGSNGGELGELLRTFPESKQAAKVEPAIRAKIEERARAMDEEGPCVVTQELRRIAGTAAGLPEETAGALRKDDDKPVENGVYACGVDQFKDKDFAGAQETLNGFADDYRKSKNNKRARNIAIAAEIADERAAAGNRLPPEGSPGGPRMEYVISNDAPDAVEILYTGPVTGVVRLNACKDCGTYPSLSAGKNGACKGSSGKYPRARLRLPAGDYHFLYKRAEGAGDAYSGNHTSGPRIQSGYTYTDCTYVFQGFGGLPDLPDLPDLPELKPRV